MDTMKTQKAWKEFEKQFPKVARMDRFMKINFEFGLAAEFHKEDLDDMLKALQSSLKAINTIEGEMQK